MMEISKHEVPAFPSIKEAKDFAVSHFAGKGYYNASLDKTIWVTVTGIKKCISGYGNFSNLRIQLLYIIPYLIQTAIKVEEKSDSKGRKNITNIYIMKTNVIINDKRHDIEIILRGTRQMVMYYYHSEINIKRGINNKQPQGSLL